jgi:hypothetical protein
MDSEGFMQVIELDTSSLHVSMHLPAVRKLSSRTSEQNGDLTPIGSYSYSWYMTVRRGQLL